MPVFWFARARLPEGPALTLCSAYGLFWGMQRTAIADVHEAAFAPLLVATALWAIGSRRWILMWIVCGLLVLVKEDLIPLVAGFGGFLCLRGERKQGDVDGGRRRPSLRDVLLVVIPWFNNGVKWSTGGAFAAVWERPGQCP